MKKLKYILGHILFLPFFLPVLIILYAFFWIWNEWIDWDNALKNEHE